MMNAGRKRRKNAEGATVAAENVSLPKAFLKNRAL
jgi:hypothetical protein